MPHHASDLERRITRRVGQAIADLGLIDGTLDQGYPGFDAEPLRASYEANGYAYRTMWPRRRSDDGRHVG